MKSDQRHSWTDIRDRIHARILDSTYRPGDKLPRDQDIASEFGCARSTVHRAMRALSEMGIVERRRKGGTTVCADPVPRATLDIPITRLEVEQGGSVYGYHLIDLARKRPPDSVAGRFGLTEPHEMLHVRALHLSDGRPYIFEDRWISLDTVPEIENVDLSRQSANEWLVRNRPYNRCNVNMFARNCTDADAAQLDVTPGQAVLIIERTTWINEKPITHVEATTAPGYRLATSS